MTIVKRIDSIEIQQEPSPDPSRPYRFVCRRRGHLAPYHSELYGHLEEACDAVAAHRDWHREVKRGGWSR